MCGSHVRLLMNIPESFNDLANMRLFEQLFVCFKLNTNFVFVTIQQKTNI